MLKKGKPTLDFVKSNGALAANNYSNSNQNVQTTSSGDPTNNSTKSKKTSASPSTSKQHTLMNYITQISPPKPLSIRTNEKHNITQKKNITSIRNKTNKNHAPQQMK